jgi:hypothetical protein
VLTGLPRLLGRSFLIGFMLPATVFLRALKVIDHAFQIEVLAIPKDTDVLGVVVNPFAIMFIAILLLALNRPIVRILEGYGRANPFKALLARQLKFYRENIEPVLAEKSQLDKARKKDPNAQSHLPDFSQRLVIAVNSYPDEAEFILSTRLGNVMRAFEVYPRVVYGIESIQTWNRLQLLLPNEAKDDVKDGHARLPGKYAFPIYLHCCDLHWPRHLETPHARIDCPYRCRGHNLVGVCLSSGCSYAKGRNG